MGATHAASAAESDGTPETEMTDDDIGELTLVVNSGNPLPRRGRWSREEEMLLLSTWREYEDSADEAQTRKMVFVKISSSIADAGGNKASRFTKQRVNISQVAFQREAERWK